MGSIREFFVKSPVAKLTRLFFLFLFRLEKQKLEEKSDWHASSDSKDCVKVDRLGNGLGRLWRQQLCQFNNVTLDISEAIAQVYKTPTSLIKVGTYFDLLLNYFIFIIIFLG